MHIKDVIDNKYAVIDDYGDDPDFGSIIQTFDTFNEAFKWATSENFHSSSIVRIDANGNRSRVW